ncbi:tyrosine-type recombinase/integrase [Arthrobacter oryzae]|uniref:tyrosine-type recombinase/integrase n=1 Tax=Arthrobacter oryzae TaxID=409290 RepID=UPI00160564BB|nr:tyrosine-type recombinase/integrase [Arthrobacter oryzae]
MSDINWRQGQITLTQHKTGTVLVLPLLADVGEAIVDYLLHGRPAGVGDDHLFLRAQAPFTALSPSSGLHYVASHAFARTQTGSQDGMGHGFRMLRASFATRMLEGDTPLPVISGALGHRDIDSAKHYLAADAGACGNAVSISPASSRGRRSHERSRQRPGPSHPGSAGAQTRNGAAI